MSCTSKATLFENGLYIGVNLQDILYGILLILYFKSMKVLLARRKQRHKSDVFYGVFSTVMFVLTTIWVAITDVLGQKMWLLDRNYPGGPMAYYAATTPALYRDFGRVINTILLQMTDGLIIYRCRIVWGSRRVVFVPSILWLANFALGIVLNWITDTPGFSFYSGIGAKIGLLYYSISALLNVTLTCMICYRLLRHARTVEKYLGHKHASPYIAIVTLVIESVLPFTLASIVFLVLYGTGSQAAITFSFVHQLTMCISPQILILQVVKGEAWKKDESILPESIINLPPTHENTSDRSDVVVHLEPFPNLHRQLGRENDQTVQQSLAANIALDGLGFPALTTGARKVVRVNPTGI